MTNKQQLEAIYQPHKEAEESPLYIPGCSHIVFGEGNPQANIMFIGEAPGKEEDKQGRPFVGRAGQLLNRTLEKLGLRREDVFITNVVKCRPPENRTPTQEEIQKGKQLLNKEIEVIEPKAICALGSTALRGLFEESLKISTVRGSQKTYHGVPVVPTYHPAYVLRNPKAADTLLEDINKAIEIAQS